MNVVVGAVWPWSMGRYEGEKAMCRCRSDAMWTLWQGDTVCVLVRGWVNGARACTAHG